MCNASNHPPGCTCGFGGPGHLGRRVHYGAGSASPDWTFRKPLALWSYGESAAFSTTCPRCGARIYFVRHNGGCVYVDELGWPWPKHGCFASFSVPGWYDALLAGRPAREAVKSDSGGARRHHVPPRVGMIEAATPMSGRPPRLALHIRSMENAKFVVRIDATHMDTKSCVGELVVTDFDGLTVTGVDWRAQINCTGTLRPEELGLDGTWTIIDVP